MKFISFFAGIGGIDLGLEGAGHECVGQCEIDPYAIKVLKKHWPDVPRVGDIGEIDATKLQPADLWAGGFPCQDISNAGKREGIRGARSGLFFTWMQAVRVVRPQKLLMENVAALLHRGMGEVCGELAESGYDAEWDCIPACAVGAPHRRDRVFIVADTEGGELGDVRKNERKGGREVHALNNAGCFSRGDDRQGREYLKGFRETTGHTQWATEPGVGRVANGVPARVDRLRCLGNAVVPQVAEYIGRLLKEIEE
jgi:DNA (cytosine-5)-methyltransferase 1